jgi:hypothetical protein
MNQTSWKVFENLEQWSRHARSPVFPCTPNALVVLLRPSLSRQDMFGRYLKLILSVFDMDDGRVELHVLFKEIRTLVSTASNNVLQNGLSRHVHW